MASTALVVGSQGSVGGLGRDFGIYLRETRSEFVRMMRTRAFSLSVIGFPLMFYTLFGLLMNRGEHVGGLSVARYLLGGYAVFGAVGAALFGIGIGLAMEINAGWLELKRASPMPAVIYLMAKCTMAVLFGVVIVSLLVGMGVAFGHVSLTVVEFGKMLGLTVASAVPFACMGLLLALVVPANSAAGVTNLLYLPMSFLGGLWMPINILPHFLQVMAPALPTYQAAQLMLATLGYPSRGTTASHWTYLVGFTLIVLGLASIAFRRREENA
jgi:ABC-2 type transport system permease protein